MKKKVAIVTGSSRGIGRATAEELAKKGYQVYATMRTPEKTSPFVSPNIEVKKLDVTMDEDVQKTVEDIIRKEGQIDVLINNAGYGLMGPIEETSMEQIQKQYDVNLFGVIRMLHAVLPHMRQQKSGHVINISSIVGIVSNAGLGIYSSTKFALEAISASLAATVFPWNIKVTVVQPGPVATDFAEGTEKGSQLGSDSPYSAFVENYAKQLHANLAEGQSPNEVAQLIAKILETPNPLFRYQTHETVTQKVEEFIADPTGTTWLKEQTALFSDWFQ